MWLGSRLDPATSASIGVNSSAFVSLISEKLTPGLVWNSSSRDVAVCIPAKPPPRITMCFLGRVAGSMAGGSGPRIPWRRSVKACTNTPMTEP